MLVTNGAQCVKVGKEYWLPNSFEPIELNRHDLIVPFCSEEKKSKIDNHSNKLVKDMSLLQPR